MCQQYRSWDRVLICRRNSDKPAPERSHLFMLMVLTATINLSSLYLSAQLFHGIL